jgi:glycosyltransferase involved in cell wall biosynthesis
MNLLRKMRVLFIAPRLPLPADTGGKIRTFNLLKQISRDHTVDLATFSFDGEDAWHVQGFRELGIAVTLVPAPKDDTLRKVITVLLSALPYSVSKYHSKKMEKALVALKAARNYDVVHFDHIHMAQYVRCVEGIPCVLDEHNVEYKILERCGNVEKSAWRRQLYSQQAGKMKRFESRAILHYSACTAVSQNDMDILKELTGKNVPVHVLPNGVDTEFFTSSGSQPQREEDALVFTGSMDWLPNDDAVVFFCREILPLIWKQNTGVKFYIVGKSPSAAVMELTKKDRRIIATGRVDDVRTYIQRAKIFVAPIRIGGGTRLKILEAMSMQ